MDQLELMKARHSVRQYQDIAIPADVLTALQREVDACNAAGSLHIQLVTDEPRAFDGMMAHYGKFSGVKNYAALIGKGDALDEKLGYYGERIALKAQELGLNTCWVAMTFGKGTVRKKCAIGSGEKLACVLALGYGKTQGVAHQEQGSVCPLLGGRPDARLVPLRHGGSYAGAYCHESAEVFDFSDRREHRPHQKSGRVLLQDRPWHREVSLRTGCRRGEH